MFGLSSITTWAAGGVLAALLAFGGAQTARLHHAQYLLIQMRADDNEALAKAEQDARAKESTIASATAAAASNYEKGKTDAKANADALFAGLLSDNVRLRATWRCPTVSRVPATPAAPAEPDATADDRAAGARDLVRAAAECDAQVTALQALVRADRSE